MFTSITYLKTRAGGELYLDTEVKRFNEADGNCSFKMSPISNEEDAKRIIGELGLDHLPFKVLDVS